MELVLETAGESHGPTLTAILAGIPCQSPVSEDFVNARLAARQRGYGSGARQRSEHDTVTFLAGVRDGHATGNPIALSITNRDRAYRDLPPVFAPRPGHADLAGALNRGSQDARDVIERASARETAVRVAAGAVAAQFLEALGIVVLGHVVALGGVDLSGEPSPGPTLRPTSNPVEDLAEARTRRDASDLHTLADRRAQEAARTAIDAARKAGDTLGGVVEVLATGVPLGLGGHERPESKLSSTLASALMGIQAVRGVELGLGFRAAGLLGSAAHDAILPAIAPGQRPSRASNHAGGIEGGTSNGQPLVVRAAMKPLASLHQPLPSVDLRTGLAVPARVERSDVCAVPRLAIVAEMAVALDLARHVRRRFGGASLAEVRAALRRGELS